MSFKPATVLYVQDASLHTERADSMATANIFTLHLYKNTVRLDLFGQQL